MALTEREKALVFEGVRKKTKGLQKLNERKPDYDKSWLRNFLETLGEEYLVEGNPALDTFEGLLNENPLQMGKGMALSALGGLRGNVAKDIGGKVGKLAKKGPVLDDLFSKLDLADETGVFGNVLETKVARAKKLIEESGAKKVNVEGSTISWTTKEGEKRTVDISRERFGSRSLGTNPRATTSSPRDYSLNPRITRETDQELLGRSASDAAGMSTEEINRSGRFYRLGKNGEPTYLGKKVDAGKAEGAIIQVKDGKASIYQGSGTPADLARFEKTSTYKDIVQKSRPGEAGAIGANVPTPKKTTAKTVTATKLPTIDLPGRFKLTDKRGSKNIKFASDFDKAVYNLVQSKKPNQDLLGELQLQTGFDEDTLMQHGIKIKNAVDKMDAAKVKIELKPRSVQVIGDAKPESIGKQILKSPSELKFSIDLPALRQSARPTVTHPIQSGLPALKNSLKSITERGYREQLEGLIEDSPVYDALDTATALGDKKAKDLYPNISELQKLAGSKDLTEYFSGAGSWAEKLPLIGEGVIQPSKRMFDMYQRTIRGKEAERIAKRTGSGDITSMLKDPAAGKELGHLVNRVNDETGYGTLGPYLEGGRAGELLSNVFTAPRNVAAKAQFYNPGNYFGSEKFGRYGKFNSPVQRDFLEDQAKWVAGTAGAIGGAELLGGEGEFNPLSSQFGVNFDNYRPDIFGGEKAFLTTLPRSVKVMRESSKGNEYEGNPLTDWGRAGRYRLRPGLPAMAIDALNYNPETGHRENALGEGISIPYDEDIDPLGASIFGEREGSRWLAEQFTPSLPGDISEAMEYAGPLAAAASVPLGFLGMGSASYDPNVSSPYRPPKKFIKVKATNSKAGSSGQKRKLIR